MRRRAILADAPRCEGYGRPDRIGLASAVTGAHVGDTLNQPYAAARLVGRALALGTCPRQKYAPHQIGFVGGQTGTVARFLRAEAGSPASVEGRLRATK